tara:strand:- start:178 stop:357 length:180 start_codon:yes stop_codon:yes gene_type:complete
MSEHEQNLLDNRNEILLDYIHSTFQEIETLYGIKDPMIDDALLCVEELREPYLERLNDH